MFEGIFDYLNSVDFDYFSGINLVGYFSYLVSLLCVSIICFLPIALLIKIIRGLRNG